MKQTVNGFITWRPAMYGSPTPSIDFLTFDPRTSGVFSDRVVVREHSIEIEVEDDFDPRPTLRENLRAEEQQVRADFAKRIIQIQRKIGELEAITMETAT